MEILGIACFYHEASASLIHDGQLLAAAAEERFSRKKHDSNFPTQAIKFCLQQAKIKSADLDYVVFYEKPFLKFERIFFSSLGNFPSSWQLFPESMVSWLTEKLWVKNIIAENLKIDSQKILFVPHHLSHAASTYFCSPYQKSAILTLDGVGEWTSGTLGIGEENKIKMFKEISFPHSLGLLYSVFTAFLGFEVNDGEHKVMGMAAYGQPKYLNKIEKIVKVFTDGSIWLDLDYFSFHYSAKNSYSPRFINLFGEPRKKEQPFFTPISEYPSYFGSKPSNFKELAQSNQYYADIAASIQKFTEEVVLKMVEYLYQLTKVDSLCFAGGLALNSVINGRIVQESKFKNVFIQPASGDDGGSLGAALFVYYQLLNKKRNFVMDHAYWGKSYSDEEIATFLNNKQIPYQLVNNENLLTEIVADKLSKGEVIGWFQGRFEWGPRALGNRSILADPTQAEMKDIVNTKIKFREPYRPFGPVVLEEKAAEFFEIKDIASYPAKFMLMVNKVRKDKKDLLPAVTHIDGTARIQTIAKRTNPKYYQLVKAFGQKTGIPVLLNTSFNLRGEPIVNQPKEALATFKKSKIDSLVLGSYIIEKP